MANMSFVPQKIESEKVSVPWTGWDVLFVFVLWFAAQLASGVLASIISPPQPPELTVTTEMETETEAERKDQGHVIFQLVQQGKDSPIVLLVVFFAIGVAAPMIEELLFRQFFQGWLEKKLRPSLAIVAVSFCFAMLHAGRRETLDGQILFYVLGLITITSLLVFMLGIAYLVWVRNVKLTHCLFGVGRFFHPHFFAYTGCCLFTLIPILGIAAFLDGIAPNINTDPVPIFLFSLVLGTLYSRTRNLSYCILLHAFLNATSLAIVWFTV